MNFVILIRYLIDEKFKHYAILIVDSCYALSHTVQFVSSTQWTPGIIFAYP